MKLYQRYIFSQIVLYTLLCLAVFIFVLVAGKVIRDGVELLMVGRVSLVTLLELFSLLILYVVTYALPLSLLTGVLLVLGRFSAQREIVALKASGVSLFGISMPILLLGFMGALFALVVNTYLAPISKKNYKYKLTHSIAEHPDDFIQEKVFIKDFPGFTLYLNDKKDNELLDIWIWEHSGAEVTGLLKAKSGSLYYNKDEASVQLRLKNGTAEKRTEQIVDNNPYIASFDELTLKLLVDCCENNQDSSNTQMLTFFEMANLVRRYDKENNVFMGTKLRVEMQKDLASAFSVFSLIIFAIPLGIKASRKESYANLVLAVLLAGIYYVLLIITTWFVDYPELRPELFVWVPNVIFQFFGFFWLWKANKY